MTLTFSASLQMKATAVDTDSENMNGNSSPIDVSQNPVRKPLEIDPQTEIVNQDSPDISSPTPMSDDVNDHESDDEEEDEEEDEDLSRFLIYDLNKDVAIPNTNGGVKKKIVREGARIGQSPYRPGKGVLVTVQYTGRYLKQRKKAEKTDPQSKKEIPGTQEEEGKGGTDETGEQNEEAEEWVEFDSSYKRKKAFKFNIGVGRVIRAWDLAVQTMMQGEKAVVTCTHEYGYGEKGTVVIPGGATLQFEIEVLRWDRKQKVRTTMGLASYSMLERPRRMCLCVSLCACLRLYGNHSHSLTAAGPLPSSVIDAKTLNSCI